MMPHMHSATYALNALLNIGNIYSREKNHRVFSAFLTFYGEKIEEEIEKKLPEIGPQHALTFLILVSHDSWIPTMKKSHSGCFPQ